MVNWKLIKVIDGVMKHKIIVYTLAYNEEDLVERTVDYWKTLGVEKAVVYNNESTDSTVEKLSKYDWIEIRNFHTDGMTDDIQAIIKNTCWKEQKGNKDTWCLVCDFDEWLYARDIDSLISKMEENNCSCLGTKWYAICNDSTPDYEEGKLLHQQSTKFYLQDVNRNFPELGKFMLINPNEIEDMGWSVGNHICNPKGNFKIYVADINEAVAIHLNKGLSEQYFVDKRKKMAARLSSLNKMKGYCFEYNYPEEKSREEYRKCQEKSENLNEKISF